MIFAEWKKTPKKCEMVPFEGKYNTQNIISIILHKSSKKQGKYLFIIYTTFGGKQDIIVIMRKKVSPDLQKSFSTHQISSNVRGLNPTIKKMGVGWHIAATQHSSNTHMCKKS